MTNSTQHDATGSSKALQNTSRYSVPSSAQTIKSILLKTANLTQNVTGTNYHTTKKTAVLSWFTTRPFATFSVISIVASVLLISALNTANEADDYRSLVFIDQPLSDEMTWQALTLMQDELLFY